ncbi:hypothetical protein DES53_11687 [Roseimicrobium gellanilyticum]|uniref:Uncharacterized protein n=1 Tax=Roseimicrobium gellanilyticum TaxID=748857 RepID=A0A366H5E9_9BACT|nr:hypothetical protein [Roseimicrobium gellanilyticum]RBP36648.1 hypothetical protein DES53_11687 [Roseimicrobium gellanilyticum]
MNNEQSANGTYQGDANGAGGDRAPAASGNAGNNVDKIRELIFGEQMVGYDARFSQIESKLTAEVDSLRKMVESSLAELRSNFEKRANDVEKASVPRLELAAALERIAAGLRGQ